MLKKENNSRKNGAGPPLLPLESRLEETPVVKKGTNRHTCLKSDTRGSAAGVPGRSNEHLKKS